MGAQGDQARTLREWALYDLASGSQEKGQAMWQEAKEIFARLRMKREFKHMGRL